MEERQIIAKLKELREVKPDKDWQAFTKSEILGYLQPREKAFSGGFFVSFRSVFPPAKLAPVLVPLVIIVLAGAGIFIHFYLNSSSNDNIVKLPQEGSQTATYLVLAETKFDQLETSEDLKEVADMLEKAANSIDSVPKDPAETGKVVMSLKNIEKKIEEKTAEMEGLEEFEKIKITTSVLAAGVTEKIKEGKEETTAKLTEELIKAAKTWNLTEEQQKLLKEAEEDYNNGNYQQGLEKILTLTNSNTEENNTEE